MRLITRGDLDGLACAVLISRFEDLDQILIVHPQELADGRVEIGASDIIANLPFQPGCALWFDHHMHTAAAAPQHEFRGAFGFAPSAARLVFEHYGGATTLSEFEELVRETDRIDSAELTLDDILDPQGYVKLSFTIDGRSGLGRVGEYFLELFALLSANTPIEQVLAYPEVEERCRLLEQNDVELHTALQKHSRTEANVVLTDFRPLDAVPVGNRFLVFALFPKANVAVRVQRRDGKPHAMLTLGHSIVERTCRTNLGELASRYGGGGHRGAASLPLAVDPDRIIHEVLRELTANG